MPKRTGVRKLCACKQADWIKLSDQQRQFLNEADDGAFNYGVDEGSVWAMGAEAAGNLFSMEVVETKNSAGEMYASTYTLRDSGQK